MKKSFGIIEPNDPSVVFVDTQRPEVVWVRLTGERDNEAPSTILRCSFLNPTLVL